MANDSRAVGVDCGTMFFQTAENNKDGKTELKTIRNAFIELEVTDDIEEILAQNKWRYIKSDGNYYVIGEDSLKVAKMCKLELRRPMQDGILNKGEDKKMVVLSELIRTSIGKPSDAQSVVCTCVSSESVDGYKDSTYHKDRLSSMFKNLGWNVKVIEEGLAVILSEAPSVIDSEGSEVPFSGIGISFGSGRANCVLAYKGMKITGCSTARSGDWIDNRVAEQLGVPISKIISKKEKELDFTNIDPEDDVLYALNVYYEAMIEYTIKNFANKFKQDKPDIDEELDIIIAGGTSMPKGFCAKVEEVIRRLDLPFKVRNVKHASDPRNSVVNGCLIQAGITHKKLSKASSKDELLAILGG